MRKIVFIYVLTVLQLLVFITPLSAQLKKGFKLLEKGDYIEAEKYFLKTQNKLRNEVAANYGLAVVKVNTSANLDTLCNTSTLIIEIKAIILNKNKRKKLSLKDKKKLRKKYKITSQSIKRLYDDLQIKTLDKIKSISEFDTFQKRFTEKGKRTTIKKIEQTRKKVVAAALNSIQYQSYDDLNSLIKKHSDLLRKKNLRFKGEIQRLLYWKYLDENNYKQLDAFKKAHPYHWASRDCWVDEFAQVLEDHKLETYLDYLNNYPLSMMDEIIVHRIRDSNKSGALNESQEKRFEEVTEYLKLQRVIQRGKLNDTFDEELLKYVPLAAPSARSYYLVKDALNLYLHNKKWKEANILINEVKVLFPDYTPKKCNGQVAYTYYTEKETWFNTVIPILKEPAQGITLIPIKEINTPSGDEISPVISIDGKTLYFALENGVETGGTDIFKSTFDLQFQKWGKPERIDSLSSGEEEAPLAMTADGNNMLIFRNGKLYNSKLTMSGWSVPEILPKEINDFPWLGKATLSADGKVIIFEASYENSQENYLSDIDLYASIKQENGNWGKSFSLGPTINLPSSMERSPYLHTDMRTLYFSSNGHPGLGDGDIFFAKRIGDNNWTNWTEPKNMGKEINTLDNDWGYNRSISPEGNVVYLSYDDRYGSGDIYATSLPKFARPAKQKIVEWKPEYDTHIPPKELEKIVARVYDKNGKMIREVKPQPDGSIQLWASDSLTEFTIKLEQKNKNNISTIICPEMSINSSTPSINGVIKLPSKKVHFLPYIIKNEKPIVLENLNFDTNDFSLSYGAKSELNQIFKYLKRTKLKIRIIGHTDDKGKVADNNKLSEQRAQVVLEYFKMLGLSEKRIRIKAMGSSSPLCEEKTEACRAKNRRVEVVFISPKK